MRKLPRGVSLRRRKYHYERRWPVSVRHLASTDKFTLPLGLGENATDNQIARAALDADDVFEHQVRLLENSDARALTEAAIQHEATKLIKKLGLHDRAFDLSKMEIEFGGTATPEDFPKHILENIAKSAARAELADVDQPVEVKRVAERRLTTKTRAIPKRLSELWAPYCKDRGWDMDSKSGKEKTKNWERALSYIGDHPLVDSTDKEINRGFRELTDEAMERGVQRKTAVRYLSDARACFADAASEYDLNWSLRSNSRKTDGMKVVTVTATNQQQIDVVKSCIKANDVDAAIMIMAAHGVSVTEIANIESTKGLDAKIPHVVVPDGKTKDRPRVVVIGFGYDTLWENLDHAIRKCRKQNADNDPGANARKRLRAILPDSKVTLRSLRHAARNNWVMADINNGLMKACFGWSGGDHSLAMHYGASGVEDSAFIKSLHDATRKAYAHIIKGVQ